VSSYFKFWNKFWLNKKRLERGREEDYEDDEE